MEFLRSLLRRRFARAQVASSRKRRLFSQVNNPVVNGLKHTPAILNLILLLFCSNQKCKSLSTWLRKFSGRHRAGLRDKLLREAKCIKWIAKDQETSLYEPT